MRAVRHISTLSDSRAWTSVAGDGVTQWDSISWRPGFFKVVTSLGEVFNQPNCLRDANDKEHNVPVGKIKDLPVSFEDIQIRLRT